jgi:MoxR-like ATPase
VARGAVAVACVVAVVVFAHRRADAVTCDSSRTALFQAALRHTAPAETVGEVVRTCRDPEEIAVAAAGVTASGHPNVAAAMARTAIAAGPREFVAWAALAQALARDDPAAAARAARRAEALNPRWRPPTSAAPAAAAPGAAGSAGP